MEENERLRSEAAVYRDKEQTTQSEVDDLHNKITVLESKVSYCDPLATLFLTPRSLLPFP